MKVTLDRDVFLAMHDKLIAKFNSENPNYHPKDYILYGYNNFKKNNSPSIRNAILEKYKSTGNEERIKSLFLNESKNEIIYNGKYLRDAKYVRLDKNQSITINKFYLETWLFYLDYENLNQFISDFTLSKSRSLPNSPNNYSFICFYYSPTQQKVESFELEIYDEKVFIDNAPSGRSYKGTILNSNQSKTSPALPNRIIVLESNDGKLSPSSLNIVFRNNDYDWLDSNILIGYFACFLEPEISAGAIVLEKKLVLKKIDEEIDINQIKTNPFLSDKKKSIIEALKIGETEETITHIKDLCNFINDEFLRKLDNKLILHGQKNTVTTKKILIKELNKIKKNYLTLYFKNKHLSTDHADITKYESFSRHLNGKFPHWSSNQQILKVLHGSYVCYVAKIEKEEKSIEIERKKIERSFFVFDKYGKVNCHSIGSIFFEGTITVNHQKNAVITMRKKDDNSFYTIIVEIPNGVEQKKEQNTFYLKGVFCGINRLGTPTSNKVYFKQIDIKDYHQSKNQPRTLYMDNSSDREEIEQLKTDFPKFKEFFSLKSKDNFSEGGNLFFDNLFLYPSNEQKIKPYVGLYELYRGSNATKIEAIKKFPLEIFTDGTVIAKQKEGAVHGNAYISRRNLVIHFHNEKYRKFDSTILFPLFEKESNLDDSTNWLKGLILSSNERDEPFASEVLLFRSKTAKFEELDYEMINLDNQIDEFNSINKNQIQGFTNIGYYLLYRRFSSWRLLQRDHDLLLDKIEFNDIKNFINPYCYVKVAVNSFINLYFTGDTKTHDFYRKAKSLGRFFNYDIDEVEKHLLNNEKLKNNKPLINDILNEWTKNFITQENKMNVIPRNYQYDFEH